MLIDFLFREIFDCHFKTCSVSARQLLSRFGWSLILSTAGVVCIFFWRNLMRRYMIQIKYNVNSTKGLVARPQNRGPQANAIMEKLGGRLVDFYFTLGDWDAVIIVELESDAHAMAVAMADVAGEVGNTMELARSQL